MGYNKGNDVALGQLGSAYVTDENAFTPPTGRVIMAITMVETTAFTALTPELPTDATFRGSATSGVSDINCVGTVTPTAANGSGADTLGGSDVFPAGLTIYGRWKGFTLNAIAEEAEAGVICYFAI